MTTANPWFDVALACAVVALLCLALMIGAPAMKHRLNVVSSPRLSQRRASALAGVRARLGIAYILLIAGLLWAGYAVATEGLIAALLRLAVTAFVAPIPCASLLSHIHDTDY